MQERWGYVEGDETEVRETDRTQVTKAFVCHTEEFGLYPEVTSKPLKGFNER